MVFYSVVVVVVVVAAAAVLKKIFSHTLESPNCSNSSSK